MAAYQLSPDAENDLLEIARYTLRNWGAEQLGRYETGLRRCFEAIGQGEAHTSSPLPHRPEIRSLHCQHHYVFSLHELGRPPVIIAVLHESMDLMQRLTKRLSKH